MSAAQDQAIADITVARNVIVYGVAVNGAAVEGLATLAPAGDIVSGPQALTSAMQVCGWLAQYAQAAGYIQRALINAQIGAV